MRRPARSIRGRLILIIAAIAAGTLVLGFGVVTFNDARTFSADMVERTTLVARVVGAYSAGELVFGDRVAARDTLAKLSAVPMIEHATLFDEDGGTFARYGLGHPGASIAPPFQRSVSFTWAHLDVLEPIVMEGEIYGAVYLRASTAELHRAIRNHALTALALLGLLLVLALLTASRLQRIISGPILELAAATRRISETGDHSIRVARLGREDEITVLCDGMNDMLDRIQLRELERDEALHRTREKSQFLAAMSHELRTPLNSIIGFSEIVLRRADGLEPKMRRFVGNILQSGQHLLGIINDILDLSKIEAGRMELLPETVALRELIDGVVTVMKGGSDARRIEIRVEHPDSDLSIEADPVKLKQVLFNLMSNAVKFSPDASVVRVTSRLLRAADSPLAVDSVELAVIDRGIGIAPADQEKIFLPFQQASTGVARHYGGTGLGLALTRSYVSGHEGMLLLDSAPGRGSTFTVILPLQCRAARPPAAAGESVASR